MRFPDGTRDIVSRSNGGAFMTSEPAGVEEGGFFTHPQVTIQENVRNEDGSFNLLKKIKPGLSKTLKQSATLDNFQHSQNLEPDSNRGNSQASSTPTPLLSLFPTTAQSIDDTQPVDVEHQRHIDLEPLIDVKYRSQFDIRNPEKDLRLYKTPESYPRFPHLKRPRLDFEPLQSGNTASTRPIYPMNLMEPSRVYKPRDITQSVPGSPQTSVGTSLTLGPAKTKPDNFSNGTPHLNSLRNRKEEPLPPMKSIINRMTTLSPVTSPPSSSINSENTFDVPKLLERKGRYISQDSRYTFIPIQSHFGEETYAEFQSPDQQKDGISRRGTIDFLNISPHIETKVDHNESLKINDMSNFVYRKYAPLQQKASSIRDMTTLNDLQGQSVSVEERVKKGIQNVFNTSSSQGGLFFFKAPSVFTDCVRAEGLNTGTKYSSFKNLLRRLSEHSVLHVKAPELALTLVPSVSKMAAIDGWIRKLLTGPNPRIEPGERLEMRRPLCVLQYIGILKLDFMPELQNKIDHYFLNLKGEMTYRIKNMSNIEPQERNGCINRFVAALAKTHGQILFGMMGTLIILYPEESERFQELLKESWSFVHEYLEKWKSLEDQELAALFGEETRRTYLDQRLEKAADLLQQLYHQAPRTNVSPFSLWNLVQCCILGIHEKRVIRLKDIGYEGIRDKMILISRNMPDIGMLGKAFHLISLRFLEQ